jgi:hypothetical protein
VELRSHLTQDIFSVFQRKKILRLNYHSFWVVLCEYNILMLCSFFTSTVLECVCQLHLPWTYWALKQIEMTERNPTSFIDITVAIALIEAAHAVILLFELFSFFQYSG